MVTFIPPSTPGPTAAAVALSVRAPQAPRRAPTTRVDEHKLRLQQGHVTTWNANQIRVASFDRQLRSCGAGAQDWNFPQRSIEGWSNALEGERWPNDHNCTFRTGPPPPPWGLGPSAGWGGGRPSCVGHRLRGAIRGAWAGRHGIGAREGIYIVYMNMCRYDLCPHTRTTGHKVR